MVLPVKLIEFNASREESAVKLTWKTSEETNSDRFEIQHSIDGQSWNTIAETAAKGESNTAQHYEFVHFAASSGKNYYRLMIVDNDGSFAFSRIRRFENKTSKKTILYPNPAKRHFKIALANSHIINGIEIVAPNGVMIKALPLPGAGSAIDA